MKTAGILKNDLHPCSPSPLRAEQNGMMGKENTQNPPLTGGDESDASESSDSSVTLQHTSFNESSLTRRAPQSVCVCVCVCVSGQG